MKESQNSKFKINNFYPLIIVSNSLTNQQMFVKDYIKDNNILPYYVFRIEPVKNEVSIEQIRLIKKEIIVYNREKRLFIIYSFDQASDEAQNALLKTLEEKIDNNQFILLVNNVNKVILTIQSRSKIVYLNKKQLENNRAITEYINTLKSAGNYSFLADKEIIKITKSEAIKFIDKLIEYFRNDLVKNPIQNTEILKKSLQLRKWVLDNNLNPQLTIDNLLIFINRRFTMKDKDEI